MSVLVLGGSGQVARALMAQGDDVPLVLRGRPALDFDAPDQIPALLTDIKPRLILNAAAYTAVDKAENEPEAADRANHLGPRLLAAYAAAHGIPLLHISTDYVFDGSKRGPYVEEDATGPTGVYGASKLAGEHAVLASGAQAIILRTAWVYAAEGKNFVRTMLGAAQRVPKLRVVADQIGNPSCADDLAAAMLAITRRILAEGFQPEFGGVFHASGTGATSWYHFAVEIFRLAAAHGRPMPEVEPIATADYPTPAKRPANSQLDCGKLERVFGLALPRWQKSLARVVDKVCAAP
ncbi:MAG: dTDP-4-dehydrorhamnose reductase [Acetobacteraceae bacterium]|nr:dTDP-4-dehydrorhamnose reductase [Acetobacteraceae bacterium]